MSIFTYNDALEFNLPDNCLPFVETDERGNVSKSIRIIQKATATQQAGCRRIFKINAIPKEAANTFGSTREIWERMAAIPNTRCLQLDSTFPALFQGTGSVLSYFGMEVKQFTAVLHVRAKDGSVYFMAAESDFHEDNPQENKSIYDDILLIAKAVRLDGLPLVLGELTAEYLQKAIEHKFFDVEEEEDYPGNNITVKVGEHQYIFEASGSENDSTIGEEDSCDTGFGDSVLDVGDILLISPKGGIFRYDGDMRDTMIKERVNSETLGNVSKLVIPEGVVEICSSTFKGYDNICEVVLPRTLKKIASSAFSECTNIRIIEIPDGVEEIGIYAFSGCVNLESILLPNSVCEIGFSAFDGCTGLKTLVLPGISVLDYTFDDLEQLEEVEIQNGTKTLGDFCFSTLSNLRKVILPNTVETIGESCFSSCTSLSEIVIPEGVEWIRDEAFTCCESLEQITLPSTIKYVGREAFSYCTNLVEINLPEGLETIGDSVFERCSKLKSITIPRSVYRIDGDLFGNKNHNCKIRAYPDTVGSAHSNVETVSDEDVTLYVALTNEKKLGTLDRPFDEFWALYGSFFDSYSEDDVKHKRFEMIALMDSGFSWNELINSFMRRSYSMRYSITASKLYQSYPGVDVSKKAKFAFANCKEWFTSDEHEDVKRGLSEAMIRYRKLLNEKYANTDAHWLKFDTAKPLLRIMIKDYKAGELHPFYSYFQVKHKNDLIYVELTAKSESDSTILLNSFPWYWKTPVIDIWEAALNSGVQDYRTNGSNGETLARQLVAFMKKKLSENK